MTEKILMHCCLIRSSARIEQKLTSNSAMSIKFTKLSKILVITIIASLFSVEVMAEETKERETVSLNDAFTDAYFKHAKNAFKEQTILRQLNNIFLGFGGYPEKQIALDGEAVDNLFQDAMKQQSAQGMPIKTRDLTNPYSTSLLENPDYIGTD